LSYKILYTFQKWAKGGQTFKEWASSHGTAFHNIPLKSLI